MPRRVTLRSWEKKAWWPILLNLLLAHSSAANGGFKARIETIGHDLGYDAVQELCNKKIEEEPDDLNCTEDGPKLLNEVITKVEANLEIMTAAITDLRDRIERIQNEEIGQRSNVLPNETVTLNCCEPKTQTKACVFLPSFTPEDERSKQFSEKVTKVIQQTHNQTLLLRQYYAKPNGAMITFPANLFASCDDYDPRNRSWYFETATVRPKDVVVIVDTSRSMEVTHVQGRSLMELVKKGAQMVVNTLTSNDRVAVIGFSDVVSTASENSCSSEELSVATPQNKKVLTNFIESLRGKGLTNYVAALTKAAQYFLTTKNSSARRDQVLLFLSDGMPTTGGGEEVIMNTIQKDFSPTVRIMTFGIGKALQDQRNRQLLMTMSNINQSLSFFTEVNSSAQMVNSVADYYTREPTSENRSPVFTLPYFDVGGNDFIMSVCLPVRNQSLHFNGVTCIDASIYDLFKDIIDFKQGESSYAFLINNLRRVLLHPLLPKPTSLADDIGLIDIGALERDPAVQDIMFEMTNGLKGQKTIQAQQIVSRGDPHREGVEAVWHTSTYAWAPIPKTNFSVCIVFRSGEASPRFPQGYDPNFIFHVPTSKYWRSANKCFLNNRIVLNNKTSVEFPATFFKYSNATEHAIDDVTLYMRNQSVYVDEFKKIPRNSVAFTAETLFWNNDSSSTVFVWRYLATVDGTLRVFPGITLNSQYDVRQRSWYQRTLNNKGKLVFSGPYLDFWGSGYVVSISKAICKGSCEPYIAGRPLVAVIGGDVTIYHLYDLFIQSQAQCDPVNSCILIDNSGYIVLHHDFIYPKKEQAAIESVHISVKEPEIAQTLVDENILQVKGCIDMLNNMKNKYFWQIPSFYNTNRHFENFNFYPIYHTNLFLITKKPSKPIVPSTPNVNCQFVMSLINATIGKEVMCKELRTNDQLYDCSCSSPSEFNHCKNTLNLYELSDFWPTCMPESAQMNINMSYYNDPSDFVQPCKPTNCQDITSQHECRRHLGCMWCLQDSDGEQFQMPHCIKESFCYFGILGHMGPNNEQGDVLPRNSDGIGTTWVVVISCIAVIPLVMIIVICVVCIKRQRKKRFAPKPDSLPILLRTSLVDIGVDNPSLLWNPLDQSGSIRSKTDALSLHKLNCYSGSTTSGSIQHLTQKVEALVHHLENQSALPSPLPLLGPVRYESEIGYPYYPPDNISVDSQSVYTRSSSRPTSMVSSIPSSPSTTQASVCRPRPKPRTIFQPSLSRTSSTRDRVNSISRPPSQHAKQPTHLPCTRQPSERTWPGEPLYPSQLGMPREPSERTCPCAHHCNRQCCGSRPCSVYSTRSDPCDWVDIRQDEGRHPEVIPEIVVRRSSSFRQRRTPTEQMRRSSLARSNSTRSRRSSSLRLSDDSIRAGILRLFQEISSDANLAESANNEEPHPHSNTKQQDDEVEVVVHQDNQKSKVC